MTDMIAAIQDEVTTAVSKDQLDLPTLPEVALRIRDVAESEDVSAAKLVKAISEDPGLSAQIIKVANSAMFRAANTIEDLQMAVSRVGIDYAANLAVGLAMQQMFQATSDIIDRKMRQVWGHATKVAAISSVLAKRYTSFKVDQAALAGLTHNIGALPVLAWAEENDHMIPDSITLDRAIDGLQGALGTMILGSWSFPPEISLVPTHYASFERDNSQPDLIDVVTVANLEALAGTTHPLTKINWQDVTAYEHLGINPTMLSEEEVKDEMSEAISSFTS